MFGKRSDQTRTPEDRARAAAERAARRAGKPLPPEAFEYTVRPPDVEPHAPLRDEDLPEREVGAPEEVAPPPKPAADAPEPSEPEAPESEPPVAEPAEDTIHQPTLEYTPFQTDEHAVPDEPASPAPEPPRPAPDVQSGNGEPRLVAARGFPSDGDEVRAYAGGATAQETAEHAFDDEPEPEPPPPAPLRRAPERPASGDAPRRRAAPNAPRASRRRRRRAGGPQAPKGPRRTAGGHWGRRIFAVVALAVIVAALYVVNATFQPFHGDGEGRVVVAIPENSDAGEIGRLLAGEGVVDSARFFELNATISGERGNLRPGRYTFRKGMSNGAVIDALVKLPEAAPDPKTVKVTLVEGPSRKENAPVVDDSGKVEGSYAKASASEATLRRIRRLGAPKGTKTAEGFLFPATYEVKEGSPASELVKQQLDAFEENFEQVDMTYAKRRHLTRYDVLIIASMIEREAQLARERRLVSAVIYNRLEEDMPLAIDATIRYSTNNWKRPIRQSELDAQEPYNTRMNRGLPPTPIGNPGLASMKAAAKPANKSYLFYVRKPGKSGEHAFSSTDAEFAKDLERYQRSRENG